MLAQQTMEKLRSLRLNGFAQLYEEQLQRGDVAHLSFDDRLGLMVERECVARDEKRTNRRLKEAHLKQPACTEDINYRSHRGLDRGVMQDLSTCRWIRAKRNLLVTGSTGTGKTWLACAFANKACREGLSSYYARVPRLIHELSIARIDGSYLKLLAKLARMDLLVLDDLGLCPLEHEAQQSLLEVIDDRSGNRSTLVTSQLPVDKWYETFADPTIADALLDRLLGNAQQLKLKGKSLRDGREDKTQEPPETKA